MLDRDAFLFPVLYLGDKPSKTVDICRPNVVEFKAGPDYDRPYAFLSEEEGKTLVKRSPYLFAFAPDVLANLEALRARHENGAPAPAPRRGRKPVEV